MISKHSHLRKSQASSQKSQAAVSQSSRAITQRRGLDITSKRAGTYLGSLQPWCVVLLLKPQRGHGAWPLSDRWHASSLYINVGAHGMTPTRHIDSTVTGDPSSPGSGGSKRRPLPLGQSPTVPLDFWRFGRVASTDSKKRCCAGTTIMPFSSSGSSRSQKSSRPEPEVGACGAGAGGAGAVPGESAGDVAVSMSIAAFCNHKQSLKMDPYITSNLSNVPVNDKQSLRKHKKSLGKDLDITSNGRLLVYLQMTREPML